MHNDINKKTRKTFLQHLMDTMRSPDECWNWTGYVGKNGYAYASYNGVATTAYRASWMHFRGKIPDAYEVDHLCKNPRCINPRHLEPVTPYENNMRSNSPASLAAKKTHCSKGHPFSFDNTAIIIRSGGKKDRRCKLCHASRARAFNAAAAQSRKAAQLVA